MATMNSNLKQFAQMLSEELKNKKPEEIISAVPSIPSVPEINNVKIEESRIDAVANYITKKKELKEQDNIEQNRWNDPLKQEPKFVTFKDMNDHYGLFLQRIQQQMSSMGGGGEVKFARLDDINSATVGTNKYLTYDQNTRKFYFDTIDTGEGIYLDIDNAVALSVASTTELGGIKIGDAFEIDGSDALQLRLATNTYLGGVKLGPGVTVNDQDQIIIDSTGLDFSFGDFAATIGTYTSNTEYAILSAINDDEDVVIASNGTGGIHVVGEFRVHATNGALTETLESNPIFEVKSDGQIKILVPAVDSTSGAVSIVGSSLGQFISPVNTGVMLHITGNLETPGIPSRIYNDSQNAFAAFVARRFNGTVDSPTAVLANEEIMRISGTAHNGTNIPGTGNQRIVYKALGNQTPSNQGGDMEFWATPLNSTTIGKVATVGSTGITLETGKVLTGDVTGNVSGTAGSVAAANVTGTTLASNVVTSSLTTVGTLINLTVTNTISGSINGNANTATTSTNLSAATSIVAGSVSINPTSINKTSASTQTFTVSGLTTSHHIVITPGTALPYGLMIAGAWVSALNTLSIEFHNYGGNIDQGATTIQYFAWV
jgi:hypothetical protein